MYLLALMRLTQSDSGFNRNTKHYKTAGLFCPVMFLYLGIPMSTPLPLGNTSNNVDSNLEFPRLETITKPQLTTKEAAFYLNRAQQTLRCWAMQDKGVIRPIRVNGRLAWPVSDIKNILGVQ
jgi:hypothetical protein